LHLSTEFQLTRNFIHNSDFVMKLEGCSMLAGDLERARLYSGVGVKTCSILRRHARSDPLASVSETKDDPLDLVDVFATGWDDACTNALHFGTELTQKLSVSQFGVLWLVLIELLRRQIGFSVSRTCSCCSISLASIREAPR